MNAATLDVPKTIGPSLTTPTRLVTYPAVHSQQLV